MTRFNLSEWALGNRTLVLYMMLVVAVAGGLLMLIGGLVHPALAGLLAALLVSFIRTPLYQAATTLQVDVDTAKTEIAKARTEFISAQELLRTAPEATPRIKDELDLANGQWVFFDQALQRPQSTNPRALSDVFFSSENLLSAMDRVTGLYSAVKA